MSGRTESAGRGRIASLLTAGAIGALVLAGATACASSTQAAGASDTSTVPVATGSSAAASSGASASSSASASASASASVGATSSNHPMIPTTGGIVVTPQAQVSTTPTGKLTGFTTAAHSGDGLTLYLGIESQGGACGQYDVVLQQTRSSVSVGLVHLSSGGRMCPMYVTHMLVQAKLAAPLDGRRVIDLANGQTVNSPQVG